MWTSQVGTPIGGAPFSRGALYDLLRNRLYIGEIRHRDQWYPGEHEGLVAREVWDKVQAQLSSNSQLVRHRVEQRSSSLLTGMMEDAEGNRFTPSFTVKNGRRYRYYVSQLPIKSACSQSPGPIRLPAHEVEREVTERLRSFLRSDADVLDEVSIAADDAAGIQQFGAAAKKLAARWPTLCSSQFRNLLASFINRVTILENRIQIVISRTQLRRVLEQAISLFPPVSKARERQSTQVTKFV